MPVFRNADARAVDEGAGYPVITLNFLRFGRQIGCCQGKRYRYGPAEK